MTPAAKAPAMELPPSITGHLHVTEAGCYPDWQAIDAAIEESIPESLQDVTWDATCLAWVHATCRQLGEDYRVLETQNFLIASAADQPTAERTGQAFENVRRKILSRLTDLIAGPVKGKEVALIFASDEQYYRYIAHFFPEGEHPMNGGMCLRGGTYLHLAFPSTEASADLRTLAHEMTHGLLGHLPLPTCPANATAAPLTHLGGPAVFSHERVVPMSRDRTGPGCVRRCVEIPRNPGARCGLVPEPGERGDCLGVSGMVSWSRTSSGRGRP
jgi:hypothetical protein